MKKFILKVLRIRKRLLFNNVSKKSRASVEAAMFPFTRYIDFYPNATDRGYRGLIKKHYSKFIYLMPGSESKASHALNTELNQLLSL